MKYYVTIGAEQIEVELDGDTVIVDGRTLHATVTDLDGTPVRMVTIGDEVHRVVARRGATRGLYSLWVDGFRHEVEALDERTKTIRALRGANEVPTGPAPIIAPMPGMVVRIAVEVGATVAAGQGLVVMEAMKMENELRSSSAGVVKSILVQPGTAVEKGTVLIELE